MPIPHVEDLAVDQNFDVFISQGGDLATVRGREAFEQKVIIRITDKYFSIIGDIDRENAKELVRVEATRVANEMDMLDSVAEFDANFSSEQPNTLEVTIVYDTGDELEFSIDA